jgi:hypothetical protein
MDIIRAALKGLDVRPGCMMDLWKDRVGNHFLGVSISFICKDWTMHVVQLAILYFKGSHTAERIKVYSYISILPLPPYPLMSAIGRGAKRSAVFLSESFGLHLR